MELTLTTPALFFPAISLLLLAYTNRFLVLANLIRELHARYKKEPDEIIYRQIGNLRHRVILIKYMQAAGVASLLICVVCMFVLFQGWLEAGEWLFSLSMLLMVISLALSLWEIWISIDALNLRLSDLEQTGQKKS
jgi:hypothetical protein